MAAELYLGHRTASVNVGSFRTFSAPQDLPKLIRFCRWRKGLFLAHSYCQGVFVKDTSPLVVVMGLNERERDLSAGTVYNSVATIDATGEILNVHRKLMPTNAERMVWGFGDGRGLNVVQTAVGRIGCLLCWENYMPFARAAIYAQDVEIYCAPTAAHRDNWLASLQHIAREGSCFVISAAAATEGTDIPRDLPPHTSEKRFEGWFHPGNSMICGPVGDIEAAQLVQMKGFHAASIDLGQVREARRSFDVVGHYARPDFFQLTVNRTPMAPVVFDDDCQR